VPTKHAATLPTDGSKYYGIGHANATGTDVINGVPGDTLRRAVSAVTTDGDGLTFSRTRDGGAVCVAVLSDGFPHKWYAATTEELQDILEGLIEACKPVG
jgi:hypothetical protein